MELVPIIYTVLTLVAILAIATILISYVSYKIKQKKGLIDSPSTSNSRQQVKFQNPVKKVVQRITKPLFNLEPHIIKKPEPHPAEKHREQVPKNHGKDYRPKKSELKEKPRNNRIEVIKGIKNISKESSSDNKYAPPVKNKKSESELKTLGENVLDKYTDEKDDTMFMLNVKPNKDDKKK